MFYGINSKKFEPREKEEEVREGGGEGGGGGEGVKNMGPEGRWLVGGDWFFVGGGAGVPLKFDLIASCYYMVRKYDVFKASETLKHVFGLKATTYNYICNQLTYLN